MDRVLLRAAMLGACAALVACASRSLAAEEITNSIGMKLLLIPAGEFRMGSLEAEDGREDDEGPAHRVRIARPFAIGATEVTQAQYEKVAGKNPSRFQGEDRPVERVTWDDAVAFCAKLTEIERKAGKLAAGEVYRLPTEAEWEYACRAGTSGPFGSGGDARALGRHAWFAGSSDDETHPAGRKEPNAWGLRDMHGNVSEWCADWYGEYSEAAVADPKGPADGEERVIRGGAWTDEASACRSAYRSMNAPGESFANVGFRVVRTVAAKPPDPSSSGSAPPAGEIANAIGMKLVRIPAGTFMMGSSAIEDGHRDTEGPRREVTIARPFYMSATEVTQAQYQAVTGANPSGLQGADLPVTGVSWDDAVSFCRRLTDGERRMGRLPEGEEYRLPTEAEWEYACRAGSDHAYTFGLDAEKLGEYAWYSKSRGAVAQSPVARKKPNPWGLYDMHGNVQEWCADWFRYTYPDRPEADPKGPPGGKDRVVRGGDSFDDASYCRSASRFWQRPEKGYPDVGFRIIRAARPESGKDRQIANSLGMHLVLIPAGGFIMGARRYGEDAPPVEMPQHLVRISRPFYIGAAEVTRGEFARISGDDPSTIEGADLPIAGIPWEIATAFCKQLTQNERRAGLLRDGEEYRLPTEAEWEYVCRAGTTYAYFFGPRVHETSSYAWHEGNAGKKVHPVAEKGSNPWGLYDMMGNLWEWCADWFGPYAPEPVEDPRGPSSGEERVLRGGSFNDDEGACRSAARASCPPAGRHDNIGFRVVRTTPPVAAPSGPRESLARGSSGDKEIRNTIGQPLVLIPAGRFPMGSPLTEKDRGIDENAPFAVRLTKGFYIGATEVTQAEFEAAMGPGVNPSEDREPQGPVESVSWYDAVAFCRKLTEMERRSGNLKEGEEYRLPTEAEWEYACRAGTETAYSFGDDPEGLEDHARFGKGGAGMVASGEPNPWGLYDMYGNVEEWCADWYDRSSPGEPVDDPKGPESGTRRVIRGGSFHSEAKECRSAARASQGPEDRDNSTGFRIVRTIRS